MEKTKRSKGSKLMAVADRAGLRIAVSVASASPHEVRLVKQTLAALFVGQLSERLIGTRRSTTVIFWTPSWESRASE